MSSRFISFDEYRAIDAVNWSSLKHMRESPLHYQYWRTHQVPDNTRMLIGRACHMAVLEPGRFESECVVYPGKVRNGKQWDEFKAEHANHTILRADEFEQCRGIARAVRANPHAMAYLDHGEWEKTLEWTDPETGLKCKARLDFLSKSKPAIPDLKSTGDVDPRRFGTIAARMGYHCQLAWYQWGVSVVEGPTLPTPIIAVEQDPPHDVVVFSLDEDLIYLGMQECRRLLIRVAKCLELGSWPGRFSEEQPLVLPSWLWGDEEPEAGKVTFGGAE